MVIECTETWVNSCCNFFDGNWCVIGGGGGGGGGGF